MDINNISYYHSIFKYLQYTKTILINGSLVNELQLWSYKKFENKKLDLKDTSTLIFFVTPAMAK